MMSEVRLAVEKWTDMFFSLFNMVCNEKECDVVLCEDVLGYPRDGSGTQSGGGLPLERADFGIAAVLSLGGNVQSAEGCAEELGVCLPAAG